MPYRQKNRWLQVFYRNNHKTFESTHSRNQPFLKINILLLEERPKQWMTASSPVKIYKEYFKEWMTAILSVTKTVTVLQGIDGCN